MYKKILQKLIHHWWMPFTAGNYESLEKVVNQWLAWNLDCYSGGIMNSLSLPQSPHPYHTQLANLMLFFPYSRLFPFVYFSYISFPSFAWRRTESIWHILQHLSILQLQEKWIEPIHTNFRSSLSFLDKIERLDVLAKKKNRFLLHHLFGEGKPIG